MPESPVLKIVTQFQYNRYCVKQLRLSQIGIIYNKKKHQNHNVSKKNHTGMYTNEPNLVVTAGVHLLEIFIVTSRYHIIFLDGY